MPSVLSVLAGAGGHDMELAASGSRPWMALAPCLLVHDVLPPATYHGLEHCVAILEVLTLGGVPRNDGLGRIARFVFHSMRCPSAVHLDASQPLDPDCGGHAARDASRRNERTPSGWVEEVHHCAAVHGADAGARAAVRAPSRPESAQPLAAADRGPKAERARPRGVDAEGQQHVGAHLELARPDARAEPALHLGRRSLRRRKPRRASLRARRGASPRQPACAAPTARPAARRTAPAGSRPPAPCRPRRARCVTLASASTAARRSVGPPLRRTTRRPCTWFR